MKVIAAQLNSRAHRIDHASLWIMQLQPQSHSNSELLVELAIVCSESRQFAELFQEIGITRQGQASVALSQSGSNPRARQQATIEIARPQTLIEIAVT